MSRRVATSAASRKRTREAPPHSAASPAAGATPTRSAFTHFSSFKRGELTGQHPSWPAPRVTAELTRQWKAMDDAERRPFLELAEFDKARFVQEHLARADAKPKREPLPSKRFKPGNEPRQPDTPYICFWKYERPVVVAEYPHMAAPNVSREVGLRWKALSEHERREWNDLAARDRQRYEDEMAVYRQQTKAQRSTTAAPAADAASSAPAPPKTAFQCFLVHNRESLALLSMTPDEFRREMGDLWTRMGDDEKQTWHDMAAQDQWRYEAEMAALPSRPAVDSKQRLEDLKAAAKRMQNAPSLPQTAYAFYAVVKRRELQQERPAIKASDVTREVSKLWRKMNALERLPFIGDEQRDVERFVREMDERLALDGGVDMELLTAGLEGIPTPREAPQETLPPPRPCRRAKSSLPKKPMTAYNMMYLAKRQELMQTYELSQNECSALCGRMWRQMADAERQQYYRLAAQDKKRYQSEMEKYRRAKDKSSSGGAETVTRTSSKANTAPGDSFQSQQEGVLDVDNAAWMSHPLDAQFAYDASATRGFRYYVESKRSERERWTMDMWVDDWESLAAPHRQLWEELAFDGGDQTPEPLPRQQYPHEPLCSQRSAMGDLDLLYGLASAPSFS